MKLRLHENEASASRELIVRAKETKECVTKEKEVKITNCFPLAVTVVAVATPMEKGY